MNGKSKLVVKIWVSKRWFSYIKRVSGFLFYYNRAKIYWCKFANKNLLIKFKIYY